MNRPDTQHRKLLCGAIVAALMLFAAGLLIYPSFTESRADSQVENIFEDEVPLSSAPDLEAEATALSNSPAAVTTDARIEASGENTAKAGGGLIDYSNTEDGYVMVKYTEKTDKKLKVQVKGPKTVYTYSLTAGKWETFPLTDGNGKYQILVLKNMQDSRYSIQTTVSCDVKLKDSFGPYIRPNQYVNYEDAPNTVAKAASLTKKKKDALGKVKVIYDYVVKNITYDKKKAQNVKSGYVPDLDKVLKQKKGICFDYASLMTGMLRSQGVPCKMVFGYAGKTYHAWISVWVEGEGWIDNAIYFDGTKWKRMDPTFASTGNKSKSVMKYIGNGKNYSAMYYY